MYQLISNQFFKNHFVSFQLLLRTFCVVFLALFLKNPFIKVCSDRYTIFFAKLMLVPAETTNGDIEHACQSLEKGLERESKKNDEAVLKTNFGIYSLGRVFADVYSRLYK